jgi:hypothetical protein
MGLRGYLTFIVVLAALALVLAMLEMNLAAGDMDFSKAVAVERAYGLQMNAKEAVLEAARQGANEGFGAYDGTHSLAACRACMDHGCMAMMPPSCDVAACRACFRENEARQAAEAGAAAAVAGLAKHRFDKDFQVSIGGFACVARLRAEPAARNLFALDSISLGKRLAIGVRSDKFGVSAGAALPEGMVIEYG